MKMLGEPQNCNLALREQHAPDCPFEGDDAWQVTCGVPVLVSFGFTIMRLTRHVSALFTNKAKHGIAWKRVSNAANLF